MEQRNKLWRRRHQWRLFKAKMVLMATNQSLVLDEDGTPSKNNEIPFES